MSEQLNNQKPVTLLTHHWILSVHYHARGERTHPNKKRPQQAQLRASPSMFLPVDLSSSETTNIRLVFWRIIVGPSRGCYVVINTPGPLAAAPRHPDMDTRVCLTQWLGLVNQWLG